MFGNKQKKHHTTFASLATSHVCLQQVRLAHPSACNRLLHCCKAQVLLLHDILLHLKHAHIVQFCCPVCLSGRTIRLACLLHKGCSAAAVTEVMGVSAEHDTSTSSMCMQTQARLLARTYLAGHGLVLGTIAFALGGCAKLLLSLADDSSRALICTNLQHKCRPCCRQICPNPKAGNK